MSENVRTNIDARRPSGAVVSTLPHRRAIIRLASLVKRGEFKARKRAGNALIRNLGRLEMDRGASKHLLVGAALGALYAAPVQAQEQTSAAQEAAA